jgi:hypothetical protein
MSERALADPARRRGGPDRVAVALFSLAAFLLILALLGTQLSRAPSAKASARRAVLLRRVYETTVVERVLPAGVGGAGRSSVTQSVSGSRSGLPLSTAAPVTRTS